MRSSADSNARPRPHQTNAMELGTPRASTWSPSVAVTMAAGSSMMRSSLRERLMLVIVASLGANGCKRKPLHLEGEYQGTVRCSNQIAREDPSAKCDEAKMEMIIEPSGQSVSLQLHGRPEVSCNLPSQLQGDTLVLAPGKCKALWRVESKQKGAGSDWDEPVTVSGQLKAAEEHLTGRLAIAFEKRQVVVDVSAWIRRP